MTSKPLVLGLLGLFLFSIACGDDTDDDRRDDRDSGADDTMNTALYAISTQVIGDMSTTYVALVPSLEASVEVDLARALEIPGRGLAVGPEGAGVLFASSDEDARLTRYEARRDGTFERKDSLSFESYGVPSLFAFAEQFVFVSETKAYFLDDATAQAIEWNPREMSVERAIPLEGLLREGWSMTFGISARVRGDEIVFTVGYYNEDDSRNDDESRLAFLNVETGELRVLTKEDCSYLNQSIEMENGDMYFASDISTSVSHRVLGEDFGGTGCVARVKAGERDFDDSYDLSFAERTGGRTAGSLVPADAKRAYIRVLDESLLPEQTEPQTPDELAFAPYFRWMQLDLEGDAAPEPVSEELAPGPSSVLQYRVEGRVLTNESAADYSNTTLLDMAAKDGPKKGLTITGVPFSIVRVH